MVFAVFRFWYRLFLEKLSSQYFLFLIFKLKLTAVKGTHEHVHCLKLLINFCLLHITSQHRLSNSKTKKQTKKLVWAIWFLNSSIALKCLNFVCLFVCFYFTTKALSSTGFMEIQRKETCHVRSQYSALWLDTTEWSSW